MRIALAQLNPTVGDLIGNHEAIAQAAQEAAAAGATLMVTPELALCGYPPRDLLLEPGFLRRLETTQQQLADALPAGLSLLLGTVLPNPDHRRGQRPLFNGAVLLRDGQAVQHFRKRLLPTYDVFDEDRYFQPGDRSGWFELGTLRIGVSICEDLWNDEGIWGQRHYAEDPIADLAAAEIDLLINLSASPYWLGKPAQRERLVEHAAIRCGAAVLYVNQVGGNDDLIFDGSSLACAADGALLDRAACGRADLRLLDWRDGQLVPVRPPAPAIADDHEALWRLLVLGLGDYARKCGFRQLLLGLSGGIDSALVAMLAAAAVGPEQVLAVLMPSPYSSDHSVRDALALAEGLGIRHETVAIAPMMTAFEDSLAPLFAGREPDVTEENLQSRIRGTLLMAIANKYGHLLVTTGNKSELAVGYCTLYGDMNGGLAAIADLPKTRVFSLCRWINSPTGQACLGEYFPGRPTPRMPEAIITKPPSAELRPGQLDQDSLPDYAVLDDILERRINGHEDAETIIAAGHDRAVVEKVLRLVRIAEFKRRQAAPGLKVTDRAFGSGWRMPIAARW